MIQNKRFGVVEIGRIVLCSSPKGYHALIRPQIPPIVFTKTPESTPTRLLTQFGQGWVKDEQVLKLWSYRVSAQPL